ncbi:uncharacterized protein BJX67DRAFT_347364 [Aspergillus lucknowensis]|uniref:Uncharacterized protein n=1 Tax=Aspergillus lucknowensis TaxID=176173 RepID=A0ABR4LY37_9EURO
MRKLCCISHFSSVPHTSASLRQTNGYLPLPTAYINSPFSPFDLSMDRAKTDRLRRREGRYKIPATQLSIMMMRHCYHGSRQPPMHFSL